MEAIHWITAGLAAFIVGVASAGACVVYFKRRIDALTRQIAKVDQARQTAMQHGLQARTQIDMLQKELAELRRQRPQVVPHATLPSRREELDQMLNAGDHRASAVAHRGPLPSSGFADTMPI